MNVELRKFIVETGSGIDQHGQNVTNAAAKAVRDAIARACMCGLSQILQVDWKDIYVDVLIACPYPNQCDGQEAIKGIPFLNKTVAVVEGGMIAKAVVSARFQDKSDEMYVANAAVTVSVNMDKVRENIARGK